MSRLEELKTICKDKQNSVIMLKKIMDEAIIIRDIKLLFEKHSNYQNPKSDYYLLDSLEIRITKGILEITDRRGSAFLWGFEVEYNNCDLRFGDTFMYNKKLYSVAYVDNSNSELLAEIEKVISEFESTYQYLKQNNDISNYTYNYKDEHEDVICSDIFNVYNAVLIRKP